MQCSKRTKKMPLPFSHNQMSEYFLFSLQTIFLDLHNKSWQAFCCQMKSNNVPSSGLIIGFWSKGQSIDKELCFFKNDDTNFTCFQCLSYHYNNNCQKELLLFFSLRVQRRTIFNLILLPVVNLTNILRAALQYKSFAHSCFVHFI